MMHEFGFSLRLLKNISPFLSPFLSSSLFVPPSVSLSPHERVVRLFDGPVLVIVQLDPNLLAASRGHDAQLRTLWSVTADTRMAVITPPARSLVAPALSSVAAVAPLQSSVVHSAHLYAATIALESSSSAASKIAIKPSIVWQVPFAPHAFAV